MDYNFSYEEIPAKVWEAMDGSMRHVAYCRFPVGRNPHSLDETATATGLTKNEIRNIEHKIAGMRSGEICLCGAAWRKIPANNYKGYNKVRDHESDCPVLAE
jgi:hypothetical protein